MYETILNKSNTQLVQKEECETLECVRLMNSMNFIANHLKTAMKKLDKECVTKIIDEILKADKIFVMGAGRSGLVAKAFAMRLMHLGFNVYVIGETITPAANKKDVVIAISGSGETTSMVSLGKVTKEIGSKLITITSNKDSTLGKLSDNTMIIYTKDGRSESDYEYSSTGGGYLERHLRGEYTKLAPLGTIFEITSLVVLDALIAELMYRTGKSEDDLILHHTKHE
ncbi:MAG TPA: 6-phospho-3-hexuloisomerase [Methanosarcinales archaeon]|nr:6-phospho-3-hexuloisomerase [Methanosarcinales archaeon]